MIHKYLHFARHSLTTPLHHHSTASLSAFFAALHPTSELFSNAFGLFRRQTSPVGTLRRHFCPFLPPDISLRNPSGDTFALFRHPTPPVGTLRRHFCPFLPPDTSRRNPQATLLPFFAARHLPSEPSGDTFALFCRPTPPVGTLRRHFCPFLPPDTSRRNPQATLLPFFAARHLTSKIPNDTLDHFCHPESMQPIFPDSTVDSSIAPKTTFC